MAKRAKTANELPKWIADIEALGPCPQEWARALPFLRRHKTALSAWKACRNASWMVWLVRATQPPRRAYRLSAVREIIDGCASCTKSTTPYGLAECIAVHGDRPAQIRKALPRPPKVAPGAKP